MSFFKNKAIKILCIVFAVIILLVSTLFIGARVRRNWKPWSPNYDKVNIVDIINKPTLTNDDYNLLYRQTGLTKLGIDGLLEKGEKSTILKIQDYFFESQDIYYKDFAPLMGYMRRHKDSYVPHAALENGDILFSPSTFLSFIEMGHSAMVINEDSETLIQASGYDTPSNTVTANNIFVRPAFIVLRVNADYTTRNAVSTYAKQELMKLDYDILAGIFEPKAPENIKKTHCSHIVWYAYNHFGIDVDGTGGKIVTPLDLTLSENVSVVQIYGIDIEKYN